MKNKHTCSKQRVSPIEFLWDLWCFCSIIGIWPRWIEPNLIGTKKLIVPVPKLPSALNGFKILQFSDLHLNAGTSDAFLNKLSAKIESFSPHLIVFTGDMLCYSEVREKRRLAAFLNGLNAPYGCYAIFGNHDYAQTVSINGDGDYDICQKTTAPLSKGFSRLFRTIRLTRRITPRAKANGTHAEFIEFLKETPFQLLDNRTITIPVHDARLNITGLGEYSAGQCHPETAFKEYDPLFPGLILLHNPDGFPLLHTYPGNIVLCGHTHGGQVNLPLIGKKFTLLENPQFKYGLFYQHNKWLYVSRGIGSVMPFRWFAPPEIACFTLENAS